jgi:hypothetical protein
MSGGGDPAVSGGGSGPNSSTQVVTQKSEPLKASPKPVLIVVCYLAVVGAIVVGYLISKHADFTIALKPDFSIFALLYVFAQAIERILEPLSRAWTGLSAAASDTVAAAQTRANKEIAFWAIATVLAALACGYFNLKFLEMVTQIGGAKPTSTFKFLDLAITALAIGSGTKPLHDLIDLIQKPKQEQTTTTKTTNAS